MPDDFDKSEFSLKRLHITVWHGLIFVNFSGDPVEDLPDVFAASESLIAPFDIAGARVAHTETYHVAANWKLVWENSQECYHCNANHPEFIRTFDNGSFSQPSLVEAAVCYTEDRRQQSATFPLKVGAESLTMTGSPASLVRLGEFASGRPKYTAANHLKPGFASVFSPDYGITFTDIPVDARHTEVRVQWLVAADAVAGRDYDVENLIHVWHQTNLQDWELCRLVQEGVQSAGFVPGPLSLDETSVAGFYYAYARMLSAAGL
jgi:phenylpropionate dioxygenase-like ring-hydroxylating dioxygenase large terminal subunit